MLHFQNLKEERPTFVTHLECSATRECYEADRPQGVSQAGKPLLVRYALQKIRGVLTKDVLAQRPADMWRYPRAPSGPARE